MEHLFGEYPIRYKLVNKTTIEFNTAELYFGLSVLFDDFESNNFKKYFRILQKRDDVKTLISTICLQLCHILIYKKQHEVYYQLPEIFCKDLWRGQNLILDLFKYKAKTRKAIEREIAFWETAEAKYL